MKVLKHPALAAILAVCMLGVVVMGICEKASATTMTVPDGRTPQIQQEGKVIRATRQTVVPFADGFLICPFPFEPRDVYVLCMWHYVEP